VYSVHESEHLIPRCTWIIAFYMWKRDIFIAIHSGLYIYIYIYIYEGVQGQTFFVSDFS
jgi:hypothetical protein